MGTNVYAVRKNPREIVDWKKAEEAVRNKDPWALSECLEKFEGDSWKNRVHLGKRSSGWKFLFDFQNWTYYNHTEDSIKDFLKDCWSIEDEYGRPYTIDEFWKDFVLWNPGGLDGKSYYLKEGCRDTYAPKRNYYESSESPAGAIPEDLPYRFSNDIDFS